MVRLPVAAGREPVEPMASLRTEWCEIFRHGAHFAVAIVSNLGNGNERFTVLRSKLSLYRHFVLQALKLSAFRG